VARKLPITRLVPADRVRVDGFHVVRFLVDANVLSEATKLQPDAGVVAWLSAHETELAINPIILGELRFGILLLPKSKRKSTLLQ
jgi:toxin FitB